MKMNAKQTIRGFLLLILLFLSQLIMALPPSKPVTFVHNEGPVVTVRWYAENAEGYRLFYAPYPEEEPIEMMEMGTRTEYSLRLPENSSYYVAVQAYNQDGDSPYSDSKYFVIDKFALMDIADVDPNALPLRFDHVAVDGHIAFLPTEADAEEQAQRLRTAKRINNRSKRANQLSSPVFQEDGKIGVRVDIAPGIVERDLLLSFCLEIGDECRTLLVWDDDAVNYYGETLFVPSVKTDVAKSLYADLLMPLEVINELRNLVKVPQEFNLRITAVNSINPQNIAVYVIKVPIVDVGDHQTRSIEFNDGKMSFASKNFGSDKFGVAFDIGMELYMYAGYFGEGEDGVSVDQAQYDGDFIVGIQAGPEISVLATVFGNEITFFGGGLKFTKNLSKNVSITTELTLLNVDLGSVVGNVIDAIEAVYDITSPFLSEPSKTKFDNTIKFLEKFPIGMYCKVPTGTAPQEGDVYGYRLNTQFTDEEAGNTCSEAPERLGTSDENEVENDDGSNSISLPQDLINIPLSVAVGYKSIFLVWIIPIDISAGVTATVGFKGTGGIATNPLVLEIDAGPYIEAGVYASAAITIIIASAGVEGVLTILTDQIKLNMRILIQKEPKFAGVIKNILSGPKGSIGLFVQALIPKLDLPPWEEKKWTLTIIDWNTFTREDSLLKWGGYEEDCAQAQTTSNGLVAIPTLDSISQVCTSIWPAWDSEDIDSQNGDGEVGGSSLPPGGDELIELLTADEPSENAEGWACFYMSKTEKANFCFAVTKNDPIIGFNIPDFYIGQLNWAKIWKNTNVSFFQNADFTGKDGFMNSHTESDPQWRGLPYNNKFGTISLYYNVVPTYNELGWACFYKSYPYYDGNFCIPTSPYKIPDINKFIASFHDNINYIEMAKDTNVFLYKEANYEGGFSVISGTSYLNSYLKDTTDSLKIFTPRQEKWVCFYEDENFGGKEWCHEGLSNISWVGDEQNDKFGSIKMGRNAKVTLYKDINYKGKSRIVFGDSNKLYDDFDDEVSSFKIVDNDEKWVCFYEDENYDGKEWCYDGTQSVSNVGDERNDEFGSIRMGKKVKIILYKDTNYNGNSKTIFIDSNRLDDFNDEVSSFKIESNNEKWVCFYEDENYGGKEWCYDGTQSVSNVGNDQNDKFGSIRMGTKVKIIFYKDTNYNGNSKTIFIDSNRLDDFNDEVSSFKILNYVILNAPNFSSGLSGLFSEYKSKYNKSLILQHHN